MQSGVWQYTPNLLFQFIASGSAFGPIPLVGVSNSSQNQKFSGIHYSPVQVTQWSPPVLSSLPFSVFQSITFLQAHIKLTFDIISNEGSLTVTENAFGSLMQVAPVNLNDGKLTSVQNMHLKHILI